MRRKPQSPLRQFRRTRTLSQSDLAHLADVRQETISKAERGISKPGPDLQARLAAILGVTVDVLFPPSVPAPVPAHDDDAMTTCEHCGSQFLSWQAEHHKCPTEPAKGPS